MEFDNPVTSAIFLRFAGPLIPVWLGGAVLVLVLDQYSVGGGPLSTPDLGLLLVLYSLMVGGLVSLLFYREWSRSPVRVELSYEGVQGRFRGSATRDQTFDYARILRVSPPGYFTARVEARSEGGASVDWMNLTSENALRLAEAWGAWRERDLSAVSVG